MEKLFSIKTARKVLIVGGIIMFAAVFTLRNLNLDYDFEQFFPAEDPDLDFYLEFREKFGTDNDFLLAAFTPERGIFDSDFIANTNRLTEELTEHPQINRVISPFNIKVPIKAPLGIMQGKIISKKEYNAKDSVRWVKDPLLDQKFISSDRKSVAVLIDHEPFLNKVDSDSLLADIQNIISKNSTEPYKLAGRIYGQKYYINKMGSELQFFAITSAILLAIFLAISFKSAWGVWLPLLIVVCTVIADLALITLFGYSISVLTTILPTILFVVGISDVVHLTEKYVHELRKGHKKLPALISAYKEIGLATLLTSVTTCIGFLTLLTSSIKPIANFGWFAAMGVMVAFILAFTLFPAFLLLLPTPKKLLNSKSGALFWKKILQKSFLFSLKKFPIIAIGFLAILGASIHGISKIEINNFLLEDLSKKDPHRKEFMFFEEQFGGVRPFEIAGKVSVGEISDWKNMKALERLTQYLDSAYGANNLVSPLSACYLSNRAFHGGNPAYHAFPKTKEAFEKIKPLIKKSLRLPALKKLYSPEDGTLRITGNVVDLGGAVFREKNAKLKSETSKIWKDYRVEFKQTGMPMLIDKNNASLSKDMLLGLLIAFGAVGLIMGVLYKSLRMVIIALIPNIIPLVFIGGFMYAFGIDLKLSTAIIFTIAFGIAVDDTIHFLARFKLELKAGRSLMTALYNTYLGAGKAIIVTSIILFAGFITLVASSFASTFYLGLLVSITLLFAVLTDLLLLPGLLYLGFKRRKIKA